MLPEADTLYGTEVFELNTNLQNKVYDLIKDVKLNYTEETAYWSHTFPEDIPAYKEPVVTRCDTATSDVYYAGTLLSESFGNFSSLLTGGEAKYCMTAQVGRLSRTMTARDYALTSHRMPAGGQRHTGGHRADAEVRKGRLLQNYFDARRIRL